MSQIIIHIGYPKTGTSFLQKKYFKLLSERGLLNFVTDGSNLMEECSEIENRNELTFDAASVRIAFDPFLVDDKVNIISRESFTGSDFYKYVNTATIGRKLKRIFPEAKVLITLRNQADIATSLYSQYVHEGGILSFDKFFAFNTKRGQFLQPNFHLDNHQFDIESLNYLKFIEFYKELWRGENMKVVLYETMKRDILFYLLDLNEFLGVMLSEEQLYEILGELDQIYVNQSYTKNQLIFARIVNRFFKSHFNHIYDDIPLLNKNDVMNFRLLFRRNFFQVIFGRRRLKNEKFDREVKKLFNESNSQLFDTFLKNVIAEDKAVYLV